MPFVLVRGKVEDYAKWKPLFDEYGATRKASGCMGEGLFRNADNPNDLVILLKWDDLEKVRRFTQSQGLREQMQRAGVVGQPDVCFHNEV